MTDIARGEIHIEVNDREALADLARIEREFDRTMRDIDRQKATVEIEGDVERLKQDAREAYEVVEGYNKRIDAAESKRSKAQLERHRDQKKAILDTKRAAVAAAEERLRAARRENTELALTEKRIAAIADREDKRSKALARASRREQQQLRADMRLRDQRERQMDREAAKSERHSRAQEKVTERVTRLLDRNIDQEDKRAAQRQKELDDVPKLERAYVALLDRVEQLNRARRKAKGDKRATLLIDVKEREAIGEMERLRRRLEAVGSPVLNVHLRKDSMQGKFIRDAYDRGGWKHASLATGVAIGGAMGTAADRAFNRSFRPRDIVRQAAGGIGGVLGRAGTRTLSSLGRLGDVAVRLGPFTASIKQAAVAMSLLGPAAVGVIGALGSLVSVVGSATVALGALSIGFLGGAIPAAFGFFTVLKPVVGEIKNAMTASKNYNKAVLEYGKNSDQAAKKLAIFKNVMKGQSEETKDAFINAGKLRDRWKEATDPARTSAFNLIGKGLQFASDNMQMFAMRTNIGMGVLERGLSRWIDGLNSVEGKSILGRMMDNFNSALEPAIDGMGNLLAVWGRFGAAASDFMPGFMRQFKAWTEGLLRGSANSEVVRGKVERMMESLKAVGRFLLAGGRLLKAFFGAGVGEGQRFLDVMTNAMNEWTAFANTAAGQQKIADFFHRAVESARALWNALAPIVSTFIRWASAISPVATAFFKGAAFVGDMLAGLLKITALRGPLTAIAATLGAFWALGKIKAATAAVIEFASALRGVRTAQTVGAGITGATTVAELAGAAGIDRRTTRNAARGAGAAGTAAASAGGQAAASATKWGRLASAVRGAGPIMLRFAGPAGIAAAAAVAFGGSAKDSADRVNELTDAARDAAVNVPQAGNQLRAGTEAWATSNLSLAESNDRVAAAQKRYNALQAKGKAETAAGRQALAELNMAIDDRTRSEGALTAAMRQRAPAEAALQRATLEGAKAQKDFGSTSKDLVPDMQKMIDLHQDVVGITGKGAFDLTAKDLLKYGDALKPIPGKEEEWAKALGALKAANDRVTSAAKNRAAAQRELALAEHNVQRAMRGFKPLTDEAGAALERLNRSIGKKRTAEISLKFPDPRQARLVMQALDRTISSGTNKKRAINVVANAKDAESAIRRLNRMKITDKRLRIVEKGGKEAVQVIEQIAGRKLTPKEARIVEKGGPMALKMLAAIAGVRLPTKVQRIMENGARGVINALANIIGIRLSTKTQKIIQSGASAVFSVLSRLASATLPTITQTIRQVVQRVRRAEGGPVTPGEKRFARMGALAPDEQRLPVIDRESTRRGRRVSKPTLMVGEENRSEVVISTNPAYRRSNIQYLKMAARALGVTMAAKGKGPQWGKGGLGQPGGNVEKLPAVKDFRALKQREEDTNREISIAESRVREPDSLIRQTGTDPATGEPVYEQDENALRALTQRMNDVLALYDRLTGKDGIMDQLADASTRAITAIDEYRTKRTTNFNKLKTWRDRWRAGAKKKLPAAGKTKASKARRKKAEQRRDRLNNWADRAQDMMDDETQKSSEAQNVKEEVREDVHDQGYRRQEYEEARRDQAAEIGVVDPRGIGGRLSERAAEQVTSANPSGEFTPTDRDVARLEAERASTQAGLGTRPEADVVRDLLAAQRTRWDAGQAMLNDADPGNDLRAYEIIQSAAGAIQSLTSELGSLPGTAEFAAGQIAAYGTARQEMLASFGSNFRMASGFGAAGAGIGAVGYGGFGRNPAFGGPAGAPQITVNNTFPTPPPDPHTWSRGIAFELQAAV